MSDSDRLDLMSNFDLIGECKFAGYGRFDFNTEILHIVIESIESCEINHAIVDRKGQPLIEFGMPEIVWHYTLSADHIAIVEKLELKARVERKVKGTK